MPKMAHAYAKLPEIDSCEGMLPQGRGRDSRLQTFGARNYLFWVAFITSFLVNIRFAWLQYFSTPLALDVQFGLYSPAQSAIKHELVKFSRGINEDVQIYERQPSKAVDDAWAALYAHAEIRIPKSEAAKLPNATWPIHNDPGYYLISLEVFHQLHCLDMIRQQLHPGHGYPHIPNTHIRHCIGAIRQALMCHGDTTAVVMQWSEEAAEAIEVDDIVHHCRDYGAIQGWAKMNRMRSPRPNLTIYVEPELDIASF
ncbi:hypothetical protein MIND_00775800 [Mycena indigotica]|uniref:Cyclochlorotine biosynthesis protein O n=1 Tax=Mycena indigotica TaxID=2126181 RepID=A0A8H6SMG0_9AGAR|nr:uncharacterized protein MIND_00775800 [Mycena indigotica]KAF7302091.1 hypothetical protein MIND_00775800 [Mycena indigotica]